MPTHRQRQSGGATRCLFAAGKIWLTSNWLQENTSNCLLGKRLFTYFHNFSYWILSVSAARAPTCRLTLNARALRRKFVKVLISIVCCWLFRTQRNRKATNNVSVPPRAPPRHGVLMKRLQRQKKLRSCKDSHLRFTNSLLNFTLYSICQPSCCCTGGHHALPVQPLIRGDSPMPVWRQQRQKKKKQPSDLNPVVTRRDAALMRDLIGQFVERKMPEIPY